MKINKIKELDLSLPEEWSVDSYERVKNEFIANFKEYHPGGFLTLGRDIHNPSAGEAKWKSYYPKGYESWLVSKNVSSQWIINGLGKKVNEIIKKINEN